MTRVDEVDIAVVGAPYRLEGQFNTSITGAAITVHYMPPFPGVEGEWTGAVADGPSGAFYCDVTGAQNSVAGEWTVWAEAILDGVVIARTFGARYIVAAEGYVA